MATITLSPGGPLKPLLKTWPETVGRMIKSVTEETITYGNQQYVVFRFTDGSGLILQYHDGESGGGYSGDPGALDDDYSDDRRARVYFGIDSLDEYTRAEEATSARYAAELRTQELATLERLKRKYQNL